MTGTTSHPKHIGSIDPTCNVPEVVKAKDPSKAIQVVYVLSHLFHMQVELFKALSSESFEHLPVFNKSAWRHYQTGPEPDDWSNLSYIFPFLIFLPALTLSLPSFTFAPLLWITNLCLT
ncbi:pyruvate dehydrogenase (acetyl-transferring) kinase isozyme 3, mitochondrial-like [Oncorhynchus kisutch]|uniref:pyruvate dehydrogenase (acetyl-transferring) kinase isozyme 3, mitochondrial-like n=1 Tax=Oncorhynchus kisutch TaxID=8019 RepID=UPI0012DEE771|nr:pyruvate dehydrogenase (acetyl-transferring) kinase isozyme 3, mitochondrial-like [Oncorhynchus kisutch]XP_031665465.1 pyruvate dehydrogenase (acetyl-transferring) kinase isozyme 3, mitochondrial-like [Oncorhynchus kisutch]XP_031665466.1 pyruvate dehydrogenase (acetyl-transferring) kinase isozyme 3, mitochondrial-like [Oncorhynchus kisutch]